MRFFYFAGSAMALVTVCCSLASAETRDLYSEFNVTGSVTVSVADTHGANRCANFWWVTRLTGGVRQLGRVCGRKTFDIPSFLGISLASKLRASAEPGTVITLSAREGVSAKVNFNN
jgi:hypothetical protein